MDARHRPIVFQDVIVDVPELEAVATVLGTWLGVAMKPLVLPKLIDCPHAGPEDSGECSACADETERRAIEAEEEAGMQALEDRLGPDYGYEPDAEPWMR
jgi:hypothetical protein